MKQTFLTALMVVLSLTSCAKTNEIKTEQTSMKSIVIFFSRSGNNYVNGGIENLPVGNTKVVHNGFKPRRAQTCLRLSPKWHTPMIIRAAPRWHKPNCNRMHALNMRAILI